MSLEACLPAELQATNPTITRIGVGQSGAGVHRVEAGGKTFVLKVAPAQEPPAVWKRRLATLELAAKAGLAPPVVHVDEARRAVLSAFVADRSLPALLGDPRTRDGALTLLGKTLRRVHDLPLPDDAERADPRALLETFWSRLGDFPMPAFVRETVARVRAEEAPPSDRPLVLSHNDVNPSNLTWDGERLMLLDWDTAGANEPLFDLAAISVFLRFDDAACRALLAAHDGAPVGELPARFTYDRRFVAVLCGVGFLQVARATGLQRTASDETLETTDDLQSFYGKLRSGQVNLGAPDGRWAFGLALIKAGAAL